MIDGDQLPTLDAPRVRLRWLTEADVDALYAVFSDRQMMRYWSSPAMTERKEAEDYLRRIHEGFAAKSLFQWGVELTQERRIIGTCTLFHIDAANAKAELGYCLGSAYWGKGHMSEALTALLDFAFTTLKLRRLEADGVVARIVHHQVPPKVEYHLTDWGQSLCPALDALLVWAESAPDDLRRRLIARNAEQQP